ncbi:MAG: GNAT family N-acetyltransferase [Clostridia bacterium]|nr:GNAT family N-acetyltransferase [Clostridia bacterium]
MKIINYEENFFNEINTLQQSQWGEGSDTDEIFNNIENYYIKISIEENELIGVAIYHLEINNKIIPKNEFEIIKSNFNKTKNLKSNELSCFIDFIIIKDKFQGQGIGSAFLEYIINFSKENKCNFIECEAIEVYGIINSKKLLQKFNFEFQDVFENYWGKKCPNFYCKQCNKKPCVCSMNKYKKFL